MGAEKNRGKTTQISILCTQCTININSRLSILVQCFSKFFYFNFLSISKIRKAFILVLFVPTDTQVWMSFSHRSPQLDMHVKNDVVRAAIPEEVPCMSYSSNLWNISTQLKDLRTEPKRQYVPQKCLQRWQESWHILTTRLKIKDIL